MCAQIAGTDGTHTGVIDVSGQAGSNSADNSTGGGGVILRQLREIFSSLYAFVVFVLHLISAIIHRLLPYARSDKNQRTPPQTTRA